MCLLLLLGQKETYRVSLFCFFLCFCTVGCTYQCAFNSSHLRVLVRGLLLLLYLWALTSAAAAAVPTTCSIVLHGCRELRRQSHALSVQRHRRSVRLSRCVVPLPFPLCFAYCFCFWCFLCQVRIIRACFFFYVFRFLFVSLLLPSPILNENQVLGVCFFFNSTAPSSCIFLYILYMVFLVFAGPIDRRHVTLVLMLLERQMPWPSRPL